MNTHVSVFVLAAALSGCGLIKVNGGAAEPQTEPTPAAASNEKTEGEKSAGETPAEKPAQKTKGDLQCESSFMGALQHKGAIERNGEVFVSTANEGFSADALKASGDAFNASLKGALTTAGYPEKADPARINKPMVITLLAILVIYVTMVYGPIAAWLVELFPTRIRYTSMSLPYHIGNGWFGGFLPTIAFAMVVASGNIYQGLWYPIVIAAMTLVIGTLFLPETKDVDITK